MDTNTRLKQSLRLKQRQTQVIDGYDAALALFGYQLSERDRHDLEAYYTARPGTVDLPTYFKLEYK